MSVYRTRFTLTFRSLHGRAPLLEIAAHRPGRTAVEAFVAELQSHIETAGGVHRKNKPQFLRDELRAHYRLWEEGVLPDDVYESSKLRILAAHD